MAVPYLFFNSLAAEAKAETCIESLATELALKCLMMPPPLYVFLDLNQWIYLSRDYYGKPHRKEHRGIASALLQKVRADQLRIPLGIVHFIEHLQNESPARRKRLAEVFELYSRGWSFGSWSDICESEVRRAIANTFNGVAQERPRVFGRGFMFTTNAKGREILSESHTKEFITFFAALSAQSGPLFDLLTTTIERNRQQQKASTSNLRVDNARASEDLRMRRRPYSREEYRCAQQVTYLLRSKS